MKNKVLRWILKAIALEVIVVLFIFHFRDDVSLDVIWWAAFPTIAAMCGLDIFCEKKMENKITWWIPAAYYGALIIINVILGVFLFGIFS